MDKTKAEKAVADLSLAGPGRDVAVEYFDNGNHVTIWQYRGVLIAMVVGGDGRMDIAAMKEVLRIGNAYIKATRVGRVGAIDGRK